MSDNDATLSKPEWFQKNGIGYVITSIQGKLDIKLQASVKGKINIFLRSLDIRDDTDRSKHIPFWIEYKTLCINGVAIFNKSQCVWHDKPYSYTIDVQDTEEIVISTTWQPYHVKKTIL